MLKLRNHLFYAASAVLAVFIIGIASSCSPQAEVLLKETPEPGVWKNSIDMKFRKIPGSNILMSLYETRVQDFTAFVDDTDYEADSDVFYYKNRLWHQDTHSWRDPGFFQTNNYPVTGVNWRDAVAFCLWLTDDEHEKGLIKRSQAYRLPTEEEWERAAGADNTPPYPENLGNYLSVMEFDGFDFTNPVGVFPPNENGFYDLAGNLWEFCLDHDEDDKSMCIIRGGAWQNWHAKYVGTKARGLSSRDIRITIYGFRVVLAPNDKQITAMRNDAMRVSKAVSMPPP